MTWPIGSIPASAETASADGDMNDEKPPQPTSSFSRASVLDARSPRAMRSNSGPPGHALSEPLRARAISRDDRPGTGWAGLARRLAGGRRGLHERLEGGGVELLALLDVDRAPRAAV